MRLIRRHYEEGYHKNILHHEAPNSQRNQERLRLVLSYKTSGSLLEIGCGLGGFLKLAEVHFSVEGMDISRTAIATIHPHFGDRVRVFNIDQHFLPQAGYEVIAAFNLLEHLRQPHKAIDKLYHALNPEGIIIGSVPNNFSLVGGFNTRLGNFFDRTHISTFTPDTWNRIFQHAGFQHIHFFGELPLGPNHCRFLSGRLWPYLAFNLMFICQK